MLEGKKLQLRERVTLGDRHLSIHKTLQVLGPVGMKGILTRVLVQKIDPCRVRSSSTATHAKHHSTIRSPSTRHGQEMHPSLLAQLETTFSLALKNLAPKRLKKHKRLKGSPMLPALQMATVKIWEMTLPSFIVLVPSSQISLVLHTCFSFSWAQPATSVWVFLPWVKVVQSSGKCDSCTGVSSGLANA